MLIGRYVDVTCPAFGGTQARVRMRSVKAKFDDRVIALHEIRLSDGSVIPVGAHGFVIEAFESPAEAYEVEFYVENPRSSGDDTVLATIGPDDFGVG